MTPVAEKEDENQWAFQQSPYSWIYILLDLDEMRQAATELF